ncbi:MAG: DUF4129 domain-containing protein, partial [Thermoplasmata archaeon]
SGGQAVLFSWHLPPWTFFAAVALVVIAVGAIAMPGLWAMSARRERRRAAADGADALDVRRALGVAAQALEGGEGPRAVVIRLYTTLLHRVGSLVGSVEQVTPEEIRSLHLERLGIRASAATTLTRLFEEARYSSHPMGPAAAERATRAISEALEDLDRSSRPLP